MNDLRRRMEALGAVNRLPIYNIASYHPTLTDICRHERIEGESLQVGKARLIHEILRIESYMPRNAGLGEYIRLPGGTELASRAASINLLLRQPQCNTRLGPLLSAILTSSDDDERAAEKARADAKAKSVLPHWQSRSCSESDPRAAAPSG